MPESDLPTRETIIEAAVNARYAPAEVSRDRALELFKVNPKLL